MEPDREVFRAKSVAIAAVVGAPVHSMGAEIVEHMRRGRARAHVKVGSIALVTRVSRTRCRRSRPRFHEPQSRRKRRLFHGMPHGGASMREAYAFCTALPREVQDQVSDLAVLQAHLRQTVGSPTFAKHLRAGPVTGSIARYPRETCNSRLIACALSSRRSPDSGSSCSGRDAMQCPRSGDSAKDLADADGAASWWGATCCIT